ncbi:MAG: PIN domain-containing protein [Chloroflexi bacterium]|nr:PIN domain-containing protein [Chloroflexota bacterium]
MNAIDTNILAYCIDSEHADLAVKAGDFVMGCSRTETVLLWQVVVELGSVFARWQRGGRATERAFEWIDDLLDEFPLILPEREVARTALRLHSTHRLQHFDALIIASRARAGVKTLYSEDLPGRVDAVIEGVHVVNPMA